MQLCGGNNINEYTSTFLRLKQVYTASPGLVQEGDSAHPLYNPAKPLTVLNSIKKMFLELLLYARHCLNHGDTAMNKIQIALA